MWISLHNNPNIKTEDLQFRIFVLLKTRQICVYRREVRICELRHVTDLTYGWKSLTIAASGNPVHMSSTDLQNTDLQKTYDR